MKQQTPFWLFTLSVLFALTLPVLIQDGMFKDGLVYAGIAKNLAEGKGTFWALHFSPTLFNVFNGHPPLAFGIEALFFKLLGSSIYTERIFSFFTFCITLVLISFLWRLLFAKSESLKNISWLPCLLWGITPLVFWSYSNNMLENSMGIFTLLACIGTIAGTNKQYPVFYLIASGVFIFLGLLCKGLPALFPLALPFILYFLNRPISITKALSQALLIGGTVVLLCAVLLANEAARTSILSYANNQIVPSLAASATSNSRFFILGRLLSELIAPGVLVLIALVYSKRKNTTFLFNEDVAQKAKLFLLIGLSASLPIMITLKQSGYYLVPAFPYFAIGFASLLADSVIRISGKITSSASKYKISFAATAVLFVGVVLFSATQVGKTSRDKDMLHDVYLIGTKVPAYTRVSTTLRTATDWSFHAYLTRNFNICLADRNPKDYNFYIEENTDSIPANIKFEKVDIPIKKYNLYKIIK